ncbi:hypothetical protein [Ornithinibacillus halotolerans]|uniref:Uncharacterized protein n=1 Tax=Ornithinibacillus halotolerans TaxID=1274357 RepID=A0A916S3S4_9BACI|nr:hypothetical protein [Ornithinibacillus halotolerans]GGA82017.1 hypothetical protein GCM10008025_26550 [Ornithinibacillus halotolerans]
MLILNERRIRDRKIEQLKNGRTAYAESKEVIRLIKRDIEKFGLHVYYDETPTGCWFIPVTTSKSS